MQRTQSGNDISDSTAQSSNHELYSRTLLEVLDDAIEDRDRIRAALIFLEFVGPETATPDVSSLLCERAAQILEMTGRASGAARVWEHVAKYWANTGQPARAIAAILHLQALSGSSAGLRGEF